MERYSRKGDRRYAVNRFVRNKYIKHRNYHRRYRNRHNNDFGKEDRNKMIAATLALLTLITGVCLMLYGTCVMCMDCTGCGGRTAAGRQDAAQGPAHDTPQGGDKVPVVPGQTS